MIKKVTKTKYFNEDNFEFTFEPIEESLIIEETEEGYKAKYLTRDEYPESPREWDNFGTMICFHKRYTFPNENNSRNAQELIDFIEDNKNIIALPIYLYSLAIYVISPSQPLPSRPQ